MSKVVLIGGNGFVGQYVAKHFLKDPSTKIQLISKSGLIPASLQPFQKHQVLDPIAFDFEDASQPNPSKAIEGASVVVNCVGIMYGTPSKFDQVHVKGAAKTAEWAKSVNARFVHVSAIGADSSSSIPYQKSKGDGEAAVLQANPEAVIVRPSIVFGPEDDFFNRFSKLARVLPFLPTFGGGLTKFQPVYVWDLARAIGECIAQHPATKGRILEVGGPKVYSYKELMALTLQQANLSRPIISLPWWVGEVQGSVLEQLPTNLFTLTRDQVRLLKQDNIVSTEKDFSISQRLSLKDLGITEASLTRAEDVLHTWLQPQKLFTDGKRSHGRQ